MPARPEDYLISIYEKLRLFEKRIATLETREDFKIYYETAFPASPFNYMFVFRTDLDELFFYDGTQWLSETVYTVRHSQTGIGATTTITVGRLHWSADYALYIERGFLTTKVLTTNDGANNWDVDFKVVSRLFAGGGNVFEEDTSADAPDVYVNHDGNPSDATPANKGGFQIICTKNNSPGNLEIHALMTYRLLGT